EDVRRHVQRVWHVGRDLGIADRSVQPRRGELWRVIAVDQVMYDAGVVRFLLPDFVEDLGRLFLVGKGLVGLERAGVQRRGIDAGGFGVIRVALRHLLPRLCVGNGAGLL